MAEQDNFREYQKRMRQLREQNIAGAITDQQAKAMQPDVSQAGLMPVNKAPSAFDPGGGGVVGAVKSMARNVYEGALKPAGEFFTGTPATPKPAAMPTYSTPSKPPVPISQQIYGDPNVLSRNPAQRYVAGQLDKTYPSAAGMTPTNKLVPQPQMTGVVNAPTAARAALAPGQFTAIDQSGRAIGGNAAQYAAKLDQAERMKGVPQGYNDPTAADRYRKFMEGSLARGSEMQARNAPPGPAMPMTRRERSEEQRGARSERMQEAGRKQQQEQFTEKQNLERDIATKEADAKVAAAEAGKASPKSEKAALLKEYVALWSQASDEEKAALWPKIEALTADEKTAQAPQTAKFKEGDVQEKNGKKYRRDAAGNWTLIA